MKVDELRAVKRNEALMKKGVLTDKDYDEYLSDDAIERQLKKAEEALTKEEGRWPDYDPRREV